MTLRLDWCDAKAARFACKTWHYSQTMPTPPRVQIGVWEDDIFKGCVIFSRGASSHIGEAFGLHQKHVAELTRVALTFHAAPVSRIVSIALKLLKRHSPGLKLVVSYADPKQGHVGGIYQAGNWFYLGPTSPAVEWESPDGRRWHSRMISPRGWQKVYGEARAVWRPDQCKKIELPPKHKYAYAFDDEVRLQLQQQAQPYPKKQLAAVV